MSPSERELQALLMDWDEGSLSEEQRQQLCNMLRNDASLRESFLTHQLITSALHQPIPQASTPPPITTPAVRASVSRIEPGVWTRLLTLAASLLLMALGARWLYLETRSRSLLEGQIAGSTPVSPNAESTSSGIAVVTQLSDATWDDPQRAVEVGDSLNPGVFRIASGFAQIEFFCGATVVLQGPAEMNLASAWNATVQRGRLRAHVPPAARGFTLETEDFTVVDLGTEFGLSVSPDGADVEVFDGEVELHDLDQQTGVQQLTAGQAIQKKRSGSIQSGTAEPATYVGIEDLASKVDGQRSANFNRWKSASENLRRDERLIAYYEFDQQDRWKRTLRNAAVPQNKLHDGAIVGARRTTGRWASKGALEFKQPGDRVRLQIPGEFESLSFMCWAKIDSLDRKFNSLFLTDGYDQGEPHWQILDTGQLYFSVRPGPREDSGLRDFKALSKPFWNPSLSGKWLHLAVTYDVQEKTITHFLNGKVLSTHSIPPKQMMNETQIGAASIGNWADPTRPDAVFAIRNLNGCIDELAILDKVLKPEEIQDIYEHGKP